MYWEICHDSRGNIIASPYDSGFCQLRESDDNLLCYDITSDLNEWATMGLEWVYYRIKWCKENKILIAGVVYQDYSHSIDIPRRKRVYEFRFREKTDAVAFKLKWL